TCVALTKLGSTGTEVRSIQSRLKSWGYYTGSVDGIYGNITMKAVMRFQANNGLTPDGICGPLTLSKIGLAAGSASTNTNTSSNQQLLAKLINGEARGESYTGQVAVGAVVLNRVRSSSFPNTIAGVIYQPGAFDAVSDGQINMSPSSSCVKAAGDALNGWDPTGGALYYYNPANTSNKWMLSKPVIAVIGDHNFCK
ncbi:MAG: spore cortex-lytic enzyme, partial [Clostridia bacterium]|nr:spore cortex-lytic enzyme [Clostridia bacterium]